MMLDIMPKITLLFFVLSLLSVNCEDGETEDAKIVQISQGSVKGYKENGIYVFYNIPYATTPKGPNKFKAPLPAPVWLQTYDAIKKDVYCHQNTNLTLMRIDPKYMSEDCLVTSVYVPDTTETNLPVVVYVHGGAYHVGHGNMMTPKSLVKNGNIISVTFNYRLGAHGFLCMGTEDIPGNAGIKDQVALLRWVKQNIAKFGGNPDDITISGYSAGSSSVELLTLSETTRGLFNKVIPESGSSVAAWSVQQDPLGNAKSVARYYGYIGDIDDVYALEAFYKNLPMSKLMSDHFMDSRNGSFMFSPCVERDTGTEKFLSKSPYEILTEKSFRKIPTLVGFTNMEGLLRLEYFKLWKDEMNENFAQFLPTDLFFESNEEKENVAKIIKDFYFGDKEVSEETVQGYVDYFSDVIFKYPALRATQLQAEANNNEIYLYEYSYVFDPIPGMNPFPQIKGANHCAQTGAVLESSSMLINESMIPEDFKKFISSIKYMWLNFIKTGKPVPEPTPELPKGWPPVTADCSPHMSLDQTLELRDHLAKERFQFWDKIYKKYYRIPVAPPAPSAKHTEL